MALYELRSYTLHVGKLAEAKELYRTLGWPAIEPHEAHLIGYFIGDVGALNQIVHLWRFDDDAQRRAFWDSLFADPDFQTFAKSFRPLVQLQENKLLTNAPWGPQA